MSCIVIISSEKEAYKGRGCHGPVLRAPIKKMPGKLLKCRAKSDDFQRKLLSRFVMSDELYQPSKTITQQYSFSDDTQVPSLLHLPAEILSLIYGFVNTAAAQVALALSCKHMAIIAKDIDLNLSVTSPKYAGVLPREVFDIPDLMQSLTNWIMPPHLKLCDHCLTMRPAAPSYWSDVDGCEGGEFWITKTGWAFRDASWHKQVHNVCPACHLSCSLSDYVDCDGCRALGRLGDVDWSRVSDSWRRRRRTPEEDIGDGGGERTTVNVWDANA